MPHTTLIRILCAATVAAMLATLGTLTATAAEIDPLLRTADLRTGESQEVTLSDGSTANVRLIAVADRRDDLRNAVRSATVTVEINGERGELAVGNYNLPVTVGGVQVSSPVVRGHVETSRAPNPWSLDGDARLMLWPAGSPWVRPGTFVYPIDQVWFASHTQMQNEPTFVDEVEKPGAREIYYHWGMDFGAAEGMVPVIAATDGTVVVAGDHILEGEDPQVTPTRYDVVYLRDDRGWYYRYSHLRSMQTVIRPGARVAMGQVIGTVGKEGGSGGWSHLHFDITARQPNGEYGIVDAYPFIWQAYQAAHDEPLVAVARPHAYGTIGRAVRVDGTRSFSRDGSIARYEWLLDGGDRVIEGPETRLSFHKPGTYSIPLRVTDASGRVDYDFAVVQIADPARGDQPPPSIHAAYFPARPVAVDEPVTFKVRTFDVSPRDGREAWDFGDGSPVEHTQSDGNQDDHNPDGYAFTVHGFSRPGDHIVTVSRTNSRGETATAHLHVKVVDAAQDSERPTP